MVPEARPGVPGFRRGETPATQRVGVELARPDVVGHAEVLVLGKEDAAGSERMLGK
jgi:hypothetical protein